MTHPVTSLKIRRPDDWHIHFRDGAMLGTVVPFTSEFFGRAIVMPNLVPPVTTTDAAIAYRDRILAAVPQGHSFTPLMTCYLTDDADWLRLNAVSAKVCLPPVNCIRRMRPPTPHTACQISAIFIRCWR